MLRLTRKIVDKPWGRTAIPPIFRADPSRKVGEVWFVPPEGRDPGVMAKYLFTSERLSIQVHPDNATAQAMGQPHGKDECWLVLDADENAELGLGTVRPLSGEELVEAARDGSLVDLIDWKRPKTGDVYYSKAGTVHALGPGLTVLEIQQPIDLTYRLFDYGRPRELHLAEAQLSAHAAPHDQSRDTHFGGESRVLVDAPSFGVAWCEGTAPEIADREMLVLPIDDAVAGLQPGECALIEAGEAAHLHSAGRFVLAWAT